MRRRSDRRARGAWAVAAVAAASVIALLVADPARGEGEGTGRSTVEAAAPISSGWEKELVLTGRLRARDAEHLLAPVTSTWQLQLKWLVEEGVSVASGDAIARFDTSNLNDQLIEVENQLIAQEQQLAVQQTDGELQRLDLELALARAEIEFRKAALDASVPEEFLAGKEYRERQLAHGKSERVYEDAVLTLSTHDSTLRASVAGLEIQIEQLTERYERLERELEELTVVATRSGIVVHADHPWFGRKVREGDQLQATFPVARIPDLDTLEVEAWVSEVDAWRMGAGQAADLTLDAYPGRQFTGKVVDVARAAELRASWGREPYFRVRIALDALDGDVMKPGMSVRCRVDVADGSVAEGRPALSEGASR